MKADSCPLTCFAKNKFNFSPVQTVAFELLWFPFKVWIETVLKMSL